MNRGDLLNDIKATLLKGAQPLAWAIECSSIAVDSIDRDEAFYVSQKQMLIGALVWAVVACCGVAIITVMQIWQLIKTPAVTAAWMKGREAEMYNEQVEGAE